MAQVLFGSNATPSLPNLDANFTELYNGRLLTSGNPLGYTTGSGGTVTQATSKSTGVTLNKVAGQIVMNAASLAAGASVNFVLTNSQIATTDVVAICLSNIVIDPTNYRVQCGTGSGSLTITLENRSGGALAEVVTLNFAIIKGATS